MHLVRRENNKDKERRKSRAVIVGYQAKQADCEILVRKREKVEEEIMVPGTVAHTQHLQT